MNIGHLENNNMTPHPDVFPKRVIWMQEEDTLKWVLVGLSSDGEIQDPKDYEDVSVPLPNQPSGRVWARDPVTGKWVNELVEASKEELAKADAAIRRKKSHDKLGSPVNRQKQQGGGGMSPLSGISSIHLKYAKRLSGNDSDSYEETIAEEGSSCQEQDVAEDGVKYHYVKPSDTFQFILLKYKITADALREANNFTGKTLAAAPKKLVIPQPILPKRDEKKSLSPVKDEKKEVDNNELVPDKTKLDDSKKVDELVTKLYSPVVVSPKKQPAPQADVQYHWVEPDDSLRWICLKYKVTANDLRHANNFSGSNLKLAPKKLIIPSKSRSSNHSKKVPSLLRRNTAEGAGGSSVCSTPVTGEPTVDSTNSDYDATLSSSLFTSSSAFAIGEDSVALSTSDRLGVVDGTEMSPLDLGQISNEVAPMPMVNLPNMKRFSLDSCESADSSDEDDEEDDESRLSSSSRTRYHDVKPTDTIEYLCMKYRVSAPELRRANIGLTGRNLQTGPKRLIIPPKTSYQKKRSEETHDTDALTTHDDETNTLALSDGHSTLTDQASIMNDEGDEPIYHDVIPNDTLQGICQLYGITAYELRRANNFRGLNLSSAPERLLIPKNARKRSKGFKTLTDEEKVQALMAHMATSRKTKKPILSHDEARAYLEFNDWNFDQALRNVKVDTEWSAQKSTKPPTTNGRYRGMRTR